MRIAHQRLRIRVNPHRQADVGCVPQSPMDTSAVLRVGSPVVPEAARKLQAAFTRRASLALGVCLLPTLQTGRSLDPG